MAHKEEAEGVPTFRTALLTTIQVAANDLRHRPANSIPGLDTLRSLAIILVISDHYWYFFTRSEPSNLAVGKFPLFYFGWAGVDLFFILSGYLIGRALWKELQSTATLNVARFLMRRGLRIWPYYYFFVAFLLVFQQSATARLALPDVFFYSNYVPGIVAGGWSLSTEEQFYLLTPLALIICCRFIDLRKMWIVPILGLIAMPIARAAVLARFGPHSHLGMPTYVVYTPIYTHADGLLFGLLLAWASVLQPDYLRKRRFLANAWLPAAGIILGILLRQLNRDLFAFTGLALIFGSTALFVIRDKSVITKLTNSRFFYPISKLSYAAYLNHILIMYALLPRLLEWLGLSGRTTPQFLAGYLLAITMSFAVAYLTFLIVESPFLQLRDRWLDRPSREKRDFPKV